MTFNKLPILKTVFNELHNKELCRQLMLFDLLFLHLTMNVVIPSITKNSTVFSGATVYVT